MSSSRIKIGLLGAGHLGKIHLQQLLELPEYEVVGFMDNSEEVRKKVSAAFGVPAWENASELMAACDAVDLVMPTSFHYAYAKEAILAGKHVFIEKPVTVTAEEAQDLLQLAQHQANIKIQVGHVERYNPAFLSLKGRTLAPLFIEGHRLALYNPRGTDVSVVLDLMIHDLDLILSLVKSPVRSVHASGVPVVSDTPDIANARIEFENGCVANLTASRISIKNMRRLRLFQRNAYVALDFLTRQAEILRLSDTPAEGGMQFPVSTGDETRFLVMERPGAPEVNAIRLELEDFAAAIRGEKEVSVSLSDGAEALALAWRIIGEMEKGIARL
ncbi:MAG: gfo/Idh/MocA family oxidoreductase [Bacteroidetes bacterium]|nr:MAG: gfo/Idh/MocA family oxidoreductase [Bacteroidota bacterium]